MTFSLRPIGFGAAPVYQVLIAFSHRLWSETLFVLLLLAALELLLPAVRGVAPLPGGRRFVRKALWEAGHLWTLDSFLLRHVRNDWSGDLMPARAVPLVTVGAAAFGALLMPLGLAGLLALEASPLRGLALILHAPSTVLFSITYSQSRYTMPLHVPLAIGAALVLAQPRLAWRGLWRAPGAAGRAVVLAGALLLLGSSRTRDLPLLRDMVVSGGIIGFRRERIEQDADQARGPGVTEGGQPDAVQ